MAEIKQYTDNGYDLSRLEIKSNQGGDMVDLRTQFIEIVVYESIYDDKIVGEVLLNDGLNYSETVPIVGNETIFISYKTLGSDAKYVEIVGRVTAPLGKARTENEKVEVYKLQFVSTTQFTNRLKRISSCYKGTISKMIGDIFSENFGTDPLKLKTLDMTEGYHKFIIPYWSPIFTIQWLTERAYMGDSSCFMFYEDVDGYHFRDILRAVRKPPVKTYRVEPVNPSNLTDVNAFMERVQSYSITSYFDRLDEHASGMHSGTLHLHDITTKRMDTQTMDYADLFDSSRHLNKHPLFPTKNREFRNASNTFRNLMPVQVAKFTNIRNNEVPDKYFLNRKSILKQFSMLRVTMIVPGNSTLRLLDTIDFVVPKIGYMDQKEEDWQDTYLSGKYLVTSIKTVINKTGNYRSTVEMAKDSLVKGIPDKYESSSSNIK